MRIARRVAMLESSPTLAISARAKELRKAGKDVLDFGLGEPDFSASERIIDATIAALKAGKTKYAAADGSPEMKQAVADYYARRYGVSYERSEISINNGAKHSLYTIFQAATQEGDEVIIPAPFWVSYVPQVILAGATPIVLPTSEENDYKITSAQLEKNITPKTRFLILNSPSNPTGMVYSEDELRALAESCVKKGVYIVYDEVYERIIYGKQHVCLAALSDEIKRHTVLVNAVSKAYCMTGFRIGYTLGPELLIRSMAKLQSHSTSNPVTFCMDAAIAALTNGDDEATRMQEVFKERLDFFHKAINTVPGVSCKKPEGAFYLFANVKRLLNVPIRGNTYRTCAEFCAGLLNETHIAAVPGEAFGAPGYARFSYAVSLETIAEGVRRMKEWLNDVTIV